MSDDAPQVQIRKWRKRAEIAEGEVVRLNETVAGMDRELAGRSTHQGSKHKMTTPPSALNDAILLAIKYEHAGAGADLTDQTRHSLMSMHTFLMQPSERYCSCLWSAESPHD